MEIIGTILLAILVAVLLLTAVTFGFTLIVIIVCTAAVMALLVVAQEAFRRWRFIKSATPERTPPRVIDGEYEDISHNKEEP